MRRNRMSDSRGRRPGAVERRQRWRMRPAVLMLEDRRLLSTFTVTNTLDDGSVGSLRYEIGLANAAGGTNTIAFNTGNGVTVGSSPAETGTIGNSILGNSIFGNSRLGIDLGNDGTTVNDAAGHAGPNQFQNAPVLGSVTVEGNTTTVTGTFDEATEPSTTLRIELFATPADPSGHGQGMTLLTSLTVTTDGAGHAGCTSRRRRQPE